MKHQSEPTGHSENIDGLVSDPPGFVSHEDRCVKSARSLVIDDSQISCLFLNEPLSAFRTF